MIANIRQICLVINGWDKGGIKMIRFILKAVFASRRKNSRVKKQPEVPIALKASFIDINEDKSWRLRN